MAENPIAELGAQLSVPEDRLAVLQCFTDAQVGALSDAVAQAARTQRRDIDDALERAVGFVPKLLRGRARKLLLPPGGGHG